jgi:SAF domain
MSRVLIVSGRDNVATALDALRPGQQVEAGGHTIVVRDEVPSGHKVALKRIMAGEPVRKYGNTIGEATTDIEPGAHVHVHNVASQRGRGDR